MPNVFLEGLQRPAILPEGTSPAPAPTGTLEISENGTYDVTEYASAEVEVTPSGADQNLMQNVVYSYNSLYSQMAEDAYIFTTDTGIPFQNGASVADFTVTSDAFAETYTSTMPKHVEQEGAWIYYGAQLSFENYEFSADFSEYPIAVGELSMGNKAKALVIKKDMIDESQTISQVHISVSAVYHTTQRVITSNGVADVEDYLTASVQVPLIPEFDGVTVANNYGGTINVSYISSDSEKLTWKCLSLAVGASYKINLPFDQADNSVGNAHPVMTIGPVNYSESATIIATASNCTARMISQPKITSSIFVGVCEVSNITQGATITITQGT